ncbi:MULTISPECIES: alpha/beta fold hydrolase [unclassified Streptomyces]|uniref:alpha/beta fold hydrolase n=1 Tax=unclassified Streptomyces TaxID=2593676 RepID=UPI000DAC589A|nr:MULTISPECIES: alpha/beta hydrolase [unclassified Streptomyces]PZT76868.1 alpha/beta hydrolase [Streptomyces sp. AC1-42W]PZT79176.1 alpha/beta hydrolase [Streptomyces sp. AC1-42T]
MDTILSSDGTPIAYRRRGEGPPVVLVGGALSTAGTDEPLARLLAPHFEVVTYDRRGRGGSGDGGPYAVEREIEDLAAVAAAAGGRPAVFGSGAGGALVLEAAAAGLPADRLAVYEPPYAPGPAGLLFRADCAARLDRLLAGGDRAGAVELFLTVSGVPAATVARMRRAPLWRNLESVAHTLAYDDALLGDGSVPADRLAAVGARTLVVCGGFSPATARSATLLLARALPRGRHRTLTGQTGEPAPQAVAPVLADFFGRDAYARQAS